MDTSIRIRIYMILCEVVLRLVFVRAYVYVFEVAKDIESMMLCWGLLGAYNHGIPSLCWTTCSGRIA